MSRTLPTLARTATAVLAAATAATLAALTVTAAPAQAAPPTGRYVALGDSFTSGPLIPTQVDLNCVRSNRNYPSVVAAEIGSLLTGMRVRGETIDEIVGAARAMGLEEQISRRDAIVAVEWADKLPELLPEGAVRVELASQGGSVRKIDVTGVEKPAGR